MTKATGINNAVATAQRVNLSLPDKFNFTMQVKQAVNTDTKGKTHGCDNTPAIPTSGSLNENTTSSETPREIKIFIIPL